METQHRRDHNTNFHIFPTFPHLFFTYAYGALQRPPRYPIRRLSAGCALCAKRKPPPPDPAAGAASARAAATALRLPCRAASTPNVSCSPQPRPRRCPTPWGCRQTATSLPTARCPSLTAAARTRGCSASPTPTATPSDAPTGPHQGRQRLRRPSWSADAARTATQAAPQDAAAT